MKGVTAVCRMRNSFLRRRRRSTPQPLTGEPSGRQSPQSLPCKGRWMRRKAQTEGCIAGLRQKYPARPGRTLPCLRRGRCSHRPGNPAVAQGPRGGRNRPPYKAAASGQQRTNTSHPPSPPAGLVPAQKDTRKARCCTPQSADADSSPYRGAFWVEAVYKASPARGGVCAARRRRRGALLVSGGNILQGPAGPCPAPVGDDARIVPETLRWRKGPAADEIARPTLRP